MMQTTRRPARWAAAALLALALALSACGNGDSTSAPDDESEPSEPAEPAEPAEGEEGETGASDAASLEPEVATLRVGITSPTPDLMPPVIATDLGFFDELGLDIEVFQFTGGGEATRALLTGDVDVLAGNLLQAVAGTGTGADMVGFYGINYTTGQSWWAQPEITSLEQLEGGSVATNPAGSMPYLVTGYMLDTLTDFGVEGVELIGVGGPGARYDALEVGQVDAANLVVPDVFTAEEAGYNRIAGAEELPGSPPNAYMAMREFVDANPNTIELFVQGVEWANDAWHERPEEVAGVLMDRLGYTDELADLVLTGDVEAEWFDRGEILRSDAELTVDLLLEAGDLEQTLEVEQFVHDRYIELG
jgi:NitT/TauT family transport system substrate-binding protein